MYGIIKSDAIRYKHMFQYKNFINKIYSSASISMWMSTASKFVTFAILTPLVLKYAATHEVAFWYILATITAVSSLVDLGLSPTFVRFYSYINSDIKNEEVSQYKIDSNSYSDVLISQFAITSVLLLLIGCYLWFLTFFILEEKYLSVHHNLDNVWLVYVIGQLVFFALKPIDCLLRGSGYIGEVFKFDLLANLVYGIVASVMIVYTHDLMFVVLTQQIAFAIIAATKLTYAYRRLGLNLIEAKLINKVAFTGLLKASYKTALIIATSQVLIHVMNLMISTRIEPIFAAAFLLSMKLISVSSELSWSPFYSKIPVFNKLRVSGQIEQLKDESLVRIKWSLLLFLLMSFFIYLAANTYLNYIENEVQMISLNHWYLFAIVYVLDRNQAMLCQLYMTANKVSFIKTYALHAITVLSLFSIYSEEYNYLSIIYALMLSQLLIVNPVIIKSTLPVLNASLREYFVQVALLPLVVLVIIGLILL